MKKSEIREILLSKEVIANQLTTEEVNTLVKIIKNKKGLNYFQVMSAVYATVRDARKVQEGHACEVTIRDVILRDILRMDVEAITIRYLTDRVKYLKDMTNDYGLLLELLLREDNNNNMLFNLLPKAFLAEIQYASFDTIDIVIENYLAVGMHSTQAEVNEKLLAEFNAVLDHINALEASTAKKAAAIEEEKKKCIELNFDKDSKDIKLTISSKAIMDAIAAGESFTFVLAKEEESKVKPFESDLDKKISELSK